MALAAGFRRYPLLGALGNDPGADPFVDPMSLGPMAYDGGAPNYVSPPSLPAFAPPAPPTRRKRKIKLGPVARCKVVPVTQRDGSKKRRRLCWDKHGHLVRNTAAGARGGKGAGRKRRVKCSLKCPKGSSPRCTGGFRKSGKAGGGKVCRKWVCRRKKG